MPTQQRDNNEGLRTAVAQRGTATAKKDDSLHSWLQAMQGEISRALPAGGLSADRLARIVLTEVRRTPLLAKCTRESFAGALMTTAQLGLEPGAGTGEAYLVPFKNGRTGKHEVTLIIGYQGMARLYYQSPIAKSLDAQVVYENDEFDYAYGLEPKLVHKPVLSGDRGKAIAYYACATFTTGGSAFVVLSPQDVERIKERSKAKKDGPWKTDYDAMARKTAIRQLFKLLPKSPQLTRAMAQDEQVRNDSALDAIDVTPEDFPEEKIVDGHTVDTATGEITDQAPDERKGDPGPTDEALAELNAEANADKPADALFGGDK